MAMMSLPSELLMAILIHLDFRDLLRCREVCTTFKVLIDDDVRTQYKVELALAGMEDSPSSSLTAVERLSVLRARQNAWSKFAWTAKENVPMRQGHAWELHGNVLAASEGARTLYFKRIPSAIRQIEGSEWVITDVSCDITQIGMDPAQDLLIIVECFRDGSGDMTCRIHLRALSTGAPHPAGPKEAMFTYKSKPRHYHYYTKTSGDYLGIFMCCAESKQLLVLDWKTGTLRLHITGAEMFSWAFLSSRLLFIACMDSEYDPGRGRVANKLRLVVIDFKAAPSSNPVTLSEADYICSFHYPPLEDNVIFVGMTMGSEAGPMPTIGVPFSVSSEHCVFLLSLSPAFIHPEDVILRHAVPTATFMRALDILAPGERQRGFAWDEWGPRGSRLFWTPRTIRAITETCDPYGTAFVTIGVVTDTLRRVVIVRDFNQLAIRHQAGGGGARRKDSGSGDRDEEQNMRVVTDATVFEPAGVFKGEVVTSLPYVERVLELPREDDYAQMDSMILTEDALVLVTSGWGSQYRCRILSF